MALRKRRHYFYNMSTSAAQKAWAVQKYEHIHEALFHETSTA